MGKDKLSKTKGAFGAFNKRILPTLGFLVVLALIFAVVYLSYYKDNYPAEPVSNGIFPDQLEWTFWADEPITATPVVHGSNVFVRTSAAVYKIDGDNGILLWRFSSPGTSSSMDVSPQVSGDLLIIPERGALLAAVSIDTGQLVWRLRTVDTNRQNSGSMRIDALMIEGGNIYVARYDWKLTAYEVESGHKLWEVKVPGRAPLDLTTDHMFVYLGASHSIYAYGLQHGQLLWEKDMGAPVTSILAQNGYLYVAFISDARCMAAIDLDTQQEVWQLESKSCEDLELRSLTTAGDVLYASDENLLAISLATGAILWTSPETGPLEQTVVSGDRIYARNNRTTLFVFDARSGDVIGSLLLQSDSALKLQPGRNPAIYGDLVIVPFGDERILAYLMEE